MQETQSVSVDHFDIITTLCSCGRVLLPILPIQDCPPVFIEFERNDDNVARMDADCCSGTVRFVALDSVDVDHPFFPVDLCDLALSSLVLAPHDPYLVVFTDGYRPRAVFVSELFRERGGHDFSADG